MCIPGCIQAAGIHILDDSPAHCRDLCDHFLGSVPCSRVITSSIQFGACRVPGLQEYITIGDSFCKGQKTLNRLVVAKSVRDWAEKQRSNPGTDKRWKVLW